MIEITDTHTKEPKLTLSSTGRVALKFHYQLPEEDRAPYIRYAEAIAKQVTEQIGVPKVTLRGNFRNDYICLRAGEGGRKKFSFVLSELGADDE